MSYHQEILALLVFGVESHRKTGYTVLATGRELGVLNVHCPGLSTKYWGFGARFKTGKHLEDVRETVNLPLLGHNYVVVEKCQNAIKSVQSNY